MDAAPPREASPPDRLPIAALGIVIAVALCVRLYLTLSTRSTAEDFYITLRYAENLASGNGFVYNAGERVLGTTTPLYALYLAAAAWLGLEAPLWGKLANIAADGAACWLLWRLALRAGLGHLGLIAAALYALSPPNLTWAISGMETSLVTACTLGLFVVTAERRPAAAAMLGAMLYMLRIDGLLAVAIAFGALAMTARRHDDVRQITRGIFVLALLCLPWTLFAWYYFGSPLPTSALAKLTVYAWMSKGTLPNLAPFVEQMTHTGLHKVLMLSALMGTALLVAGVPRLRPLAAWMLAYYAAMALSKGFLFGWYYVPPTPAYFLAAVAGGAWVVGWLGRWVVGLRGRQSAVSPFPLLSGAGLGRESGSGQSMLLAATLLLILVGLARLPGVRAQLAADQATEERYRRQIGLTLRDVVMPGERLMLEPIGYIGYFSRARVLDAVGLVSPEVIPYFRKGAISPYLDILHDLKPEWVLLRAGELEDARQAAVPPDRALEAHYRLERSFRDPKDPPANAPGFYLFRRQN